MLTNYLKIAWRSLFKNKLFSFINIFGLALSLSICMMVMIRIKNEFSYDRFHPYPDRTYRVISEISNKRGDHWKLASTPLPLEQKIVSSSDAVESTVQIYPAINQKAATATKELYIRGAFTESSFFDVFGFTLKQGNENTALNEPNSIILSKTTAENFFGKKSAIGQAINLETLGTYKITGVLNEIPGKSHLDFDVYISSSAIPQLEKLHKLPQFLNNWDSFEKGYTYLLLKENASLETVYKNLKQISKEVNKLSKDGQFSFVTEPLSAITPGSSDIFNGIGGGTSWMKVYIESGVALILLLAACFNYVNLTIARALTRAKEVGIRKVNGASRYQIFAQYVIESVLIALFALGVALIILSFVLRYKPFNDGYEMIPNVDLDYSILIIFVSFTVIIGMLAGSFPAWILSAFKPVRVLKNISTEKLFGNISLQRILIVFQFSLSLVIIIFLSAFYRQFSYLGKADYGFRKNNLITIPLNGNKPEILINALAGVTGVEKIAAISDNFGSRQTGDITALYDKEKNLRINLAYYFADQNIVPVMDLKIKAGENLPITDDQNKGKYLLVNEKAVLAMGYKMNEAIGKMVWLNDTAQATITGVVQDFYYRNPGISPQPMALINNITDVKYLTITVSTADRERLVSNLKSVWQQVTRQENFTYNWFDEYLEESSDQTATISLLGYLAFMAVSIASLGLFGLVIYTIETRRKEISVRKVIGASVNQLMVHLSRNFVKLLLISGVIAMPLGYILSRIFLQNFSSRVNFGVESVLACFILLLLIGLLTIISQTFKAARENPVKNLRNE